MLFSPVLASFADSKFLDFSPASDSMTLRINRTLCVTRYVQYVRINPQRICCRVTIIVDTGHDHPLPPFSLTGELSMDEANNSGFSTLRVSMISCHAMCILVVDLPFDSLYVKSLCACMQWLDPSEQLLE